MKNKKIKAIIFDLDNTLMDFLKMKREAIEQAIEAMIDSGLTIDKKIIHKTVDEIYDAKGMEYQTVFQELLEKLTGEVDYKILCAGIVAYRKVKESFVEPYPHVIPTLINLIKRGYKLAIVSDAPRMQGWTRLAGMRLQHFFDVVVTYEDTNTLKPEKLPFEKALALLNVNADEVLMIGDSIEKDIFGAKRMGMKTALAAYGTVKETKEADYIIKDISELLEILK